MLNETSIENAAELTLQHFFKDKQNFAQSETYVQKMRDFFLDTAKKILEKDASIHGSFHRNNTSSKYLFSLLTGISLPKTDKATTPIINKYFGEENINAIYEERNRIRIAEEKRKEEIRAKEYNDKINAIKNSIINQEFISGEDLINIAKHYDIFVHPRTVGAIRASVSSIKKDSGYVKRNYSGKEHYKIYAMVLGFIHNEMDKEPNEATESELNHLFGK